jgi:hypothetical protein
MAQDGRQLEGLVAFVERVLLPQGFEVRTNERIFDEDGIQIAEFDIDIRGKIGSTEIAWLIECRDRPAGGPAPGSWIEQLVGRRTRFAFNLIFNRNMNSSTVREKMHDAMISRTEHRKTLVQEPGGDAHSVAPAEIVYMGIRQAVRSRGCPCRADGQMKWRSNSPASVRIPP